MKLKNRRILYNVFLFSTIFSGIFVDAIVIAILLLVLFMIIYFDKEIRKGTFFQSNTLLLMGIILNILYIAWLIKVDYLN